MRRYKGFYRGQGRRGYLLAVNRLQGCCAQEARRLYKACRWLITKLIARSVAPLKLSVSARSSSHRFSEIFIARSGETLAAVAIVFIGFQIIFALSPVVYTIITNCCKCSAEISFTRDVHGLLILERHQLLAAHRKTSCSPVNEALGANSAHQTIQDVARQPGPCLLPP